MDRILVIAGDVDTWTPVETALTAAGYRTVRAHSLGNALEEAARRCCQLVLAAGKVPDSDGPSLVHWFARQSRWTPVILLAPPEPAAEVLDAGAADCLVGEPPGVLDELLRRVRKVLECAALARQRALLGDSRDELVEEEESTRRVKDLARQVAASEAAVLILGERGAGRETLARLVHRASPRSHRPFVAVRCATIRDEELFGRLELACGGTLYLDQAGELEAGLAARLFGALEKGAFDARLIASSRGEIEPGENWRLAFRLHLPPLRERLGDLPALIRVFLDRAGRELGRPGLVLTPEAEQALRNYDWPGNLRELRDVLACAVLRADGHIRLADLALPPARRPMLWKEIERRAIEEALYMNADNRTRAARQLGISLRTLQYRLKQYRLNLPRDPLQ